jgi:RNA polymerase sigma-70 factor (ECF subfamily)
MQNLKVDIDSFEKLYNDTYQDISKYVICKCSNLEDVNDIVQDVYVDFYKLLKKNNVLELNNVNAFLIGIAKNKVKKHYGLKYKLQSMFIFNTEDLNIENIPNNDIDLEEGIINEYEKQKLWDFLKNKKAIVGKIFYLYYSLEMTIKQIGKELNINESTVKNHLYRTIQEINTAFKKESDFNA